MSQKNRSAKHQSNKEELDQDGDEYTYEEIDEYDEGASSQFGMSRASDKFMKTPTKSFRSLRSKEGLRNDKNVYNFRKDKPEVDMNVMKQPIKPVQTHEDIFRKIKQRKDGIPLNVKVPTVIEAHKQGQEPDEGDPMKKTTQSLTEYKEIIPSFLPNENKYQKFQNIINQDDFTSKKIQERQKIDDNYPITRQNLKNRQAQQANNDVPYSDPFEAHIQKMEDKLKRYGYDDGEMAPGEAHNLENQLKLERRGNGFRSVQRNRDQMKLIDEGNMSLPMIDQIQYMEKKIEKELDREVKLKKDAKRLIVHALGKNIPEMDRTAKAWLKKEQQNNYLNEGPVYSNEYRQLMQKEIGKQYQVMDKFMKRGLFNTENNNKNQLQVLKEKYQQENQQRIVENKQIKEGPYFEFDYEKVKDVYNVSLLDVHFGNQEAYLLKRKQDAKATIAHIFKRKYEEKYVFQQMKDPLTLRKDRAKLDEKLRMISVAVELAKQRLEWLLYDTPFTLQQLEEEVNNQRASNVDEEKELLKKYAMKFKLDKEFYSEMQKKSRVARNILNIQMLEARALKNRTGCESISDLVLLFREFQHIEKMNELKILLNDALLNQKKSSDFFEFIKKIVEFEDEMLKMKVEFDSNKLLAEKDQDQFYNYDELALEKVKDDQKQQFQKYFKQTKLIFQFIPFWHVEINKEGDQSSHALRDMLKLDIMQAKIICQFLSSTTIEEIVTYYRHNKKNKEYTIFDKEELAFLIRENKMNEQSLKDFAQVIAIISKEYLMTPLSLFSLARPTAIQEVGFQQFKGEHLSIDAIASIIACIQMHQHNVKRLIFENCELDQQGAQLFKLILSDPNKPIISCDFENNKLGDAGVDHIVQAIKNNPKGDMRILKLSSNQLSIQAAIRISHILKKRSHELPPLNMQILKLRNNQIGNIGTETLASFIKKNMTLKMLDISFNGIGDRGMVAIAECLRENIKLEVLNLLGNEFTDKSLPSLSTAIVENKKLSLLILKLGQLQSDQQSFFNFINNGYMVSLKLKYLYLTTNQHGSTILQKINDNFLPKICIASDKYDHKIDTQNLLDFLSQVVEFQLFEGGNTSRVYKFGESLLRQIISEKYNLSSNEILIYLFENIFGPEHVMRDNLSPFHLFAKHGHIEAISYCLKLKVSPNFKTSIAYTEYPSATALHLAAGYSQIEMCEYLLKFGIEIDNKDLNGNTAMHYAAVQGSLQLSMLLVKNGASMIIPNKKNMLPLHSCVFSDNLSCFKFVLQETIKQKQFTYIGKQLEKTADIKAYSGFTCLMIALEENSEAIFEFLLDNGADLRVQDDEGNTILHRAILKGDVKKAKLLIKNNADIHARSFAGETPIMMAVRMGLLDVVRLLGNRGSDLFEKNKKGESLLHLAARTDQADLIGYLVDKGLNTMERNKDGQRPMDLAKRQGIKLMLSSNNQKDNRDYLNQYGKSIIKGRKQVPSEAESDEDDYNQKQLKDKQKAHLLNEEYIKYKIDLNDTVDSKYRDRYQNYKATDLTLQPEQPIDGSKVGQHIQNLNDQEAECEEYEEIDEGYEDEDIEDESKQNQSIYSKTQTHSLRETGRRGKHFARNMKLNSNYNNSVPYGLNDTQKTKAQNLNIQKQSAGFRGTVDIEQNYNNKSMNNTQGSGVHYNNTKIKKNDRNNEINDDDEYEYEEGEEGEEQEDQNYEEQSKHNKSSNHNHTNQTRAKSKNDYKSIN